MSRSFKDAKKNRMGFENLANKMEKAESKKGNYEEADPALWYPELDKSKNGFAIIRFLPEKDTDLPWVKTYSHGFQKSNTKTPGQPWYIEECPTTIDGKCPACESNSILWDTDTKENKATASNRKRRQSWYANVLIVSDPKNPDNEGKVKIFKFGFKIFEKIKDKLSPPEAFADEVPVNVFDMWEGANFKLKIKKVEGQVNYDSSAFEDISVISTDEKEMEQIWNDMHPIEKFVSADRFKSFEDLEKRLKRVLGDAMPGKTAEEMVEQEADAPKEEAAPEKEAAEVPQQEEETSSAEGDDTMSFFETLAKEE